MRWVGPAFVAGLTCLISTVLTVKLCLELAPDTAVLSLGIAAGLGLAWEAAKYTFAAAGLRLVGQNSGRNFAPRLGGVFLCGLTLVLVCGSVVASLGFLATVDAQRVAASRQASEQYRQAQAQLATFDRQMAALTANAEADAEAGFRTRGRATLDRVAEMQQERVHLAASLSASGTSDAPESAFFVALGSMLAGDAQANARRIRFGAHAVVAIMLELMSVAALWLLQMHRMHPDAPSDAPPDAEMHLPDAPSDASEMHPDAPDAPHLAACTPLNSLIDAPSDAPDAPTDAPAFLLATPGHGQGCPGIFEVASGCRDALPDAPSDAPDAEMHLAPDALDAPPDAPSDAPDAPSDAPDAGGAEVITLGTPGQDPRYAQAKELVLSAKAAPSYRALQESLQVGQSTARRFLDEMVREGLLRKEGKRYLLSQLDNESLVERCQA